MEYKCKKAPLNLLVQVNLKPGQELRFEIREGLPSKVLDKTFARYVPERMDDFAWENDKIAFRMYGKALEATKENAFGIDVWTKRTPDLIINKWYKTGDYHADHGEGLDYYSVGFTLGAGDIAPYFNDSIYFSKNYRRFEVLDNGPLRSTFRLSYEDWKVGEDNVVVSKTISLDAGSQLNKTEINYTISGQDTMLAAVGIVKRKEAGAMLFDENKKIMAYWEPEQKEKVITGVGTIFTSFVNAMRLMDKHLLTILPVKSNKQLIYYIGAVWNKAGRY